MPQFEDSQYYKKAKEAYIKETYAMVFNPLGVLVLEEDNVHLFYPQDRVEETLKILTQEYEVINGGETGELGLRLGYEIPAMSDYTFMGHTYKAIQLWFDKEDDVAQNLCETLNKK